MNTGYHQMDSLDKAFWAGFCNAIDYERHNNPYPPRTDEFKQYEKGFEEGSNLFKR